LGKWAESLDKGEEFHLAVFKAYFADGLNIAKIPVLVKIAESVGLKGAEEVLSKGNSKRQWMATGNTPAHLRSRLFRRL